MSENKELEKFKAFIRKLYQPEVFVLFGSRARGEELEESDYDILIVSSKFEGTPFTDRLTPIFKNWTLMNDLECICLTPEEFRRAKNLISLIPKAVEEGISL